MVAVILAAGLSLRMAPEQQAAAGFGGEPLGAPDRARGGRQQGGADLVVVGHDRWNVRKAIADLAAPSSRTRTTPWSQMTSVRAGVLADRKPKAISSFRRHAADDRRDSDRLIARFEELGADKAVWCRFDDASAATRSSFRAGAARRMYRRGINFGCRN